MAKNFRIKYAYDESSATDQSATSSLYSQMDGKSTNKSYAITLKCAHCQSPPILAVLMEECDMEIDPKKREFMDFVVTKSATNI